MMNGTLIETFITRLTWFQDLLLLQSFGIISELLKQQITGKQC